jgi:hypothetical protein
MNTKSFTENMKIFLIRKYDERSREFLYFLVSLTIKQTQSYIRRRKVNFSTSFILWVELCHLITGHFFSKINLFFNFMQHETK